MIGYQWRLSQVNSRLWLVIWVALIVVVVVPWSSFETIPRWDRMEWIPFVSPPVDFLDVVGNVLFYAPYGFLFGVQAASTRRPVALAVGSAAILSISTELTQIFSNSRFPSMTDVVCNTIGAFAGAYLATSRRRKD